MHAAGDVHPVCRNFRCVYAKCSKAGIDLPAHRTHGFLRFLKLELDAVHHVQDIPGEIRYGNGDALVFNVDAHKVACAGIKAEDAGPSAAGGLRFPKFGQIPFLHHFRNYARDFWDACPKMAREIRDAVACMAAAKGQDGFFLQGVVPAYVAG